MLTMYDPTDKTSYGMMFDIVCNEHRYLPQSGHKVLDLGAHWGFFSLYCASRGAEVTAYEPDPENYLHLENAVAIARDQGIGKINPVMEGMWCWEGIATLSQDHHSGTINILGNGTQLTRTARCIPLANVLIHEWDCVKMDIEGAEFVVLNETPVEKLQVVKYLTLELHPHLVKYPDTQYKALMEKLEKVYKVEKHELHDGRYCKLFCTRYAS